MPLLEATEVWGGTEVRSSRPAREVYRDVYYTPFISEGPWGIFDREDRLIDACVDRAYVEGIMLRQQPQSPITYTKVTEAYEAECIYVGGLHSHFGHFLVETLPRYWSLKRRGWRRPKLLTHSDEHRSSFINVPFAAQAFRALGLGPEDFISFDRPTRLRRLIVPHTSFRQQAWAHQAFGELCRHIGRRFGGYDVLARNPRPAWLSKSRLVQGVTRLANEAELEAELASRGVDILHPQEMSLPEQVDMFSRRTIIMGTTGSAFHTSVFTDCSRQIIGLSWENAINSNYKLFDAVSGARTRCYYDPETTKTEDDPHFLTIAKLQDPRRTARYLLDLIE